MKKSIVLILISIIVLNINIFHHVRASEKTGDLITITQKTEFINRRYYYVTRLEKTINLLNRIKQQQSSYLMLSKSININHLLDFNDVPEFKHQRIRNSIEQMQQNKNLRPLYEIWDEFAAYKYLEDELFIDEFTKEIFIISRNLLLQVLPYPTNRDLLKKDILYSCSKRASSSEILDQIDTIFNQMSLLDTQNATTIHHLRSLRVSDINIKVNTDEISLRFYHIKRMMKALEILKYIEIYDKTAFKITDSEAAPFTMFDNIINFEHSRVQDCIEAMEEAESIAPLFDLWDDYQQFKYIDDELYTREFFTAVFITYKNIIVNNKLSPIKRDSALSDAVKIYEKINELSSEELLEALDNIVEIVELSGLRKPLTWREWIREYWWVPPTIAGTLSYIYLKKKYL